MAPSTSARTRAPRSRRNVKTAAALATAVAATSVNAANPGGFEVIGNSGVSAQMLYLGSPDKVYFIDKAEANPISINGHPAWATEYTLSSNTFRAQDVTTNTFCAAGTQLGNGTWITVGGNPPVDVGGVGVAYGNESNSVLKNYDGTKMVRLLDVKSGPSDYIQTRPMIRSRWYPTTEVLGDGSVIIIGGMSSGAYVNYIAANEPNYEFFPPRGTTATPLKFLNDTMPLNLYPLTWVLSDGRLFMQAEWQAIILNPETNEVQQLPNITHAFRVYPGSGASTALPLTPANNYTLTALFCGGNNLTAPQLGFGPPRIVTVQYPADKSCVRMQPLAANPVWEDDDDMFEGRTMGQFINLPDGKILLLNGALNGTAGYKGQTLAGAGDDSWAVGNSYADGPTLTPRLYDPLAPLGSRWSSDGLKASEIPRLYHSGATLLPDGAVLVAGSNPNVDYTTEKYPTEYRVEKWYPLWYNESRPAPKNLPDSLTYGGNTWNFTLHSNDLKGDAANAGKVKVWVIRPGWSTHAINFSQRAMELATSYTYEADNFDPANPSALISVTQLPANANLFPPGQAWLFVSVDGIPSIGKQIMIGNGQIGTQPTAEFAQVGASSTSVPTSKGKNADKANAQGGAARNVVSVAAALGAIAAVAAVMA